MSYLRSVLISLVLLVSICQAKTGGLRASTSSQGKGLLSNAMVGLSAVAGFLFIVFIILIIKRLFFKKDNRDDEESEPELEVISLTMEEYSLASSRQVRIGYTSLT
ncbi:hypothetical protein HF521_007370 [Silurus meridionalis]|uniref:Uncharacterized protein n=1 Tax=Silurus meridionalis TaxID=175797 RepID=A0A8T0AR84_SILME|nr:hypothetical protein HF521_007370 [Silurus meridionalis]